MNLYEINKDNEVILIPHTCDIVECADDIITIKNNVNSRLFHADYIKRTCRGIKVVVLKEAQANPVAHLNPVMAVAFSEIEDMLTAEQLKQLIRNIP